MWRATVLTLFPDMFPGPLGHSLAGQGLENELWALETVDIRDFAANKHRSVDAAPFGGGPGMVMRPEVVDGAIRSAKRDGGRDGGIDAETRPLIYLTPRGRPFDQDRARELAAGDGVIVLCGRFEGIDQRVLDEHQAEEISLGDFVLSGGEPAALALMDAAVRLLPGVMGEPESLSEESFEQGLLEYPHYTRPAVWQGRTVPEVLASGHHANIQAWRREQAETVTRNRRPDLWSRYQSAK